VDALATIGDGRLRTRRDLAISRSGDGWVVKDPMSLEYFRVGERERFLLEQLREPHGLVELTRRYRERFPNDRATGQQVLAFCATLRDCSLLVSAAPDRRRGSWLAPLLSPLAIRLPGVDPTGVLDATAWLGRVLFSRAFAAGLVLAVVAVGVGLVGAAEELAGTLERLAEVWRPQYAAAAIGALVLTKSWHELGHAMACRRMGAECHEVGVMLLALTPCLYCDASDAWSLGDRWRRVVVALGGVYFEAMLAVAAAAAWLVLAPGPLRVLAAYVVVIASVSTLLLNLNPLLRFDGYYVLADAWGVSNLRGQSRDALWGGLRRWVRGDRQAAERPDASPVLLAAYGAASILYGWAILAVILWAAHRGLDAAGFRSAGDLLVGLSLAGVAIAAGRSAGGLVPRGPGPSRLGVTTRLGMLLGLALAVIAAVGSIEIDQTLRSPCRLEPAVSAEVVAQSAGRLRPRVAYGDRVTAGQVLGVLEDLGAELRRLELLEREADLAAQLASLVTRSQREPDLLSDIARLRPTLAEVRRQLATDEADAKRRRLTAPIDGAVGRPAPRPERSPLDDESPVAATWSGAPLDPENRGCTLAEGETLCRVVGDGLQAVVLLNEHDSGLVRRDDRVRLILDRESGVTLAGRVETIALTRADDRLGEGERALEDALRGSLDEGAVFRVGVSLAEPSVACQPGALGRARIVTGSETVAGWVTRWLRRLVRFG